MTSVDRDAAADEVAARAQDRYRDRFRIEPDGVWVAPGRVNLIGEHTDYNDGFVLPFAIEFFTAVAIGRRDDDVVRAWSAQQGAAADVTLSTDAPPRGAGWVAYVAGVAWSLRQAG